MAVMLLDERLVLVMNPIPTEVNDIRLVKQGILKEEEIESGKSITGPVCQIRNDLIEFDQLPDRFILKLKKDTADEYATRTRNIIKAEFVITAIGINFSYFISAEHPIDKLNSILIKEDNELGSFFKGGYQSTFFSRKLIKGEYSCGITVDQWIQDQQGKAEDGIKFALNYDKRDFTSQEEVALFVDKFNSLRLESRDLINKIAKDIDHARDQS